MDQGLNSYHLLGVWFKVSHICVCIHFCLHTNGFNVCIFMHTSMCVWWGQTSVPHSATHHAIIPTLAQWPRLNSSFDPPPNLSLQALGYGWVLYSACQLDSACFFPSSLVCFLAAPPLRSWQLKSALELLNTEAGRIRPFNTCHGQRLYQWFSLSKLHRCQWHSIKIYRKRNRRHF